MRDLYEVLGVSRTAALEEIKKTYRKLARRFHPDVNPGNADAEKRFREIQEAYSILSDTDKRAQYDEFGTVDDAAAVARQAAYARRRGATRVGGFGTEGFTGFGDLGDLFGNLFRGFGARPQAARVAPVETAVELDFAHAVRGATTVVPVRREAICMTCGGSGHRDGRMCAACHGTGVIVHTHRLRVRFPAGIADGDRVRAGLRDGSGQEATVVVRVRPHPYFERKGDDIYTTVPVTFTEAYLGADVEIGTIHGPVRARIPVGTQTGKRFRLRGKGVRNVRTNVQGDHYYTVNVMVPLAVTPAGRDLARRVDELYGGNPRAELPTKLE